MRKRILSMVLFATVTWLPIAAYSQDPDEPKSGDEGSSGDEGTVSTGGEESVPVKPQPAPMPKPKMNKMKKMMKMHKKMHGSPCDGCDIVRAEAGNMGMFFSFFGLATMGFGAVDTVRDQGNVMDGVVMAGMKLVPKDNVIIPIGIGLSFFHSDVDSDFDTDTNSFGMALSAGLEYHFRVWKRISPYFGAKMHLDYLEPNGDNNWEFGFNLGPALGIEYYIADRVSINAEYNLLLDLRFMDGKAKGGDVQTDMSFGTGITNAGGVYLSFYF